MSKDMTIWDYFEKPIDKSVRRATCKLCNGSYSYESTTSNLRIHLENKHADEITISLKKDRKSRTPTKVNANNHIIWGYFTHIEGTEKLATCNLCDRVCNYRSTRGNLRAHLKRVHSDAYNRFLESSPLEDDVSKKFYLECSDNDDSDGSTKQGDINSFFELETGGRVRCVVCRASFPQHEDTQRAHLKEKHPKLLDDQDQDQDEPMPFHSDDDPEQDTYTEVIYIDEPKNEKFHQKSASKLKRSDVKPQKRREIRRDSTSSDEYLIKKSKTEEPDELKDFIKYITCLLKKLPSDTCMKLQMEIVNLIMNASLNNKCDSTVSVATPTTSYYMTVPDKLLQSTSQETHESTSSDIGTNVTSIQPIIISSMKDSETQ